MRRTFLLHLLVPSISVWVQALFFTLLFFGSFFFHFFHELDDLRFFLTGYFLLERGTPGGWSYFAPLGHAWGYVIWYCFF